MKFDFLTDFCDAFIFIDFEYRIEFLNKAAETLLGTRFQVVEKKDLFDAFPGFFSNSLKKLFQESLSRECPEKLCFSLDQEKHYEVKICSCKSGFALFLTETAAPEKKEEDVEVKASWFHAIIKNSPAHIAYIDADKLVYKYANEKFLKAFGLSIDEISGRHIKDVIGQKNFEDAKKFLAEVKAGRAVSYVNTFSLVTGRKWIEVNYVPDVDSSGRVIGILVLSYDITEQKETEEKLKASEALYQDLVETSQDLILAVDADKKITFVNHNSEKILGLTPDECTGSRVMDFCHPDDRQASVEWFNECIAEKKSRDLFENRLINAKTNEEITLAWACSFEYDDSGNFIRLNGIARDLTSMRLAERNYQTLFEKMLDGFALHEIILDDDGIPVDYRFLNVNPAFEKLTGLKNDLIRGKTLREILPDSENSWIELYGKVALTGEPAFFENYARQFDKYFEVTAFKTGEKQFACIFVDITSRKKAEKEREILESRLRQTQKLEAIGTLSGGIAHDFNNILAAIIGYTEIAQMKVEDDNQASLYLDQVLKAGNRAKKLVAQILAFSRQSEKSREPVNVNLLAKEVLLLLRASIPTTIEIKANLDVDCGLILANPTQVHQVLMNLCSNAAQAMEDQGGVLEIDLKRTEIDKLNQLAGLTVRPGTYICLSVSDNGSGIKKDHLDRIFDPYFTTKPVGKGSGLGLAVVHGIVQSHKGYILVKSEPGQGTTFELYFPMMKERIVIPEESVKPVLSGNGKERILIVDDDPNISELLKKRLQLLGYEATAKTCSKDAIEAFRTNPDAWDLMITDQTMPHLTGDQLSKEILKIRPDFPIIMCTGYSTKIDAQKAAEIGIKAFFLKPVDKDELAQSVRQLLDNR